MAIFTSTTFKNILKNVDFNNDFDFETFSESLSDYSDSLSSGAIDSIIDFVDSELGVPSDSELNSLSKDEILELCDYINDLVE